MARIRLLLKELGTVLIFTFLFLLLLTWCSQGIAQHRKIDEGCWYLQQACDEALEAADEVIVLQMKAYSELKKDNNKLEKDIMILRKENFELNNPPWHKDPIWTGVAGIIGGMFIVLSLQK